MPPVSVVIPAYNEENAIAKVVSRIRETLTQASIEHEIVVVIDGATDRTLEESQKAADRVVEHPQNLGYGRSLKSGILAARYDLIAITDADGTYPVERLPDLIALADKFDMVVGARTGQFYRGSFTKWIARGVFRWLSEFSVGQSIPDINSGLRVFRRSHMLPFFSVISAGFSFTTTSTLAYLHNDLCVHYVPIAYHRREGRSKVRHLRDSLRAFQIIVEAILRCNPIKVFLLIAVPFMLLSLLLAVIAGFRGSTVLWLSSVTALSTSAILLGMGFLAVAIMPQRRIVGATSIASRPEGNTGAES